MEQEKKRRREYELTVRAKYDNKTLCEPVLSKPDKIPSIDNVYSAYTLIQQARTMAIEIARHSERDITLILKIIEE